MNQLYDVSLKHPKRYIIYGPSQSGKTTFVENLLINMKDLYGFNFDKIVYFSGKGFPNLDIINNINIIKLPSYDFSQEFLEYFDKKEQNLLIFDDSMHKLTNDLAVSELFTNESNHRNISVIFIIQNLFPKSKYLRDISLNSTYFILMTNPRDKSQVKRLATQIDGHCDFIYNSYENSTKNNPFSYFLIDVDQNTFDEVRFRANIFPHETPHYTHIKI